MRQTKLTRRATALLLSVAMVFTMSGTPVYAVSGTTDAGGTGLCEHHPVHTADCGYEEAQPGTPGGHKVNDGGAGKEGSLGGEHTDECYRLVEACLHEHGAECYAEEDLPEDEATPSNAEELDPVECSHVCGEDTGCITKVLDCDYTEGTEGSPCTYVCGICNAADGGKQENQEQEECICEDACTEESVNGDCPVCGAQGADLSGCKGIKDVQDEAAEKRIAAWEWVDPDGNLVDGGLALPGVNEENQADLDTVVSMLPEEIKVTLAEDTLAGDTLAGDTLAGDILAEDTSVGEEEPDTVTLAGWTCESFVQDENGGWPVTGTYEFTAKLPEGYGLEKGADPLEVPVTFGGANMLLGEKELIFNGLTFEGDDLTGITQTADGQIVIGAGGNYTISGTWNRGGISAKSVIVVKKDVTADITLDGVTIDVSGTSNLAAFQIADDSTGDVHITLKGENILKSGIDCAGLQKNGAGKDIGKLTIDGEGTLTANGGQSAAGIGGGESEASKYIAISGGTVTATGGQFGAGIGGGFTRSGSGITISGGIVNAAGGSSGGAGIGGGSNEAGFDITIDGGTVNAVGGSGGGAGIGGGYSGGGSDITINKGDVTASSEGNGAGIGGGESGVGSNITINGGTVTATGGALGAGIGGGMGKAGKDITINGGYVTATGKGNGAGIGGGDRGMGVGSVKGAGINIVISGGTVIAASVNGGAGIGSGYRGTASSGNKLTGNAVVFATKGKSVSAHIQGFSKSDLTSGVLFEGNAGKVYGNPAIAADVTIPGGKTLTIEAEQALTIEEGVTLTNEGTITNKGAINNHGTIIGNIDGNQPNTTPSKVASVVFVKEGGSETDKAAIGETVSLRATIVAANTRSRMAAPDEVVFKLNGEEIATAAVTDHTANVATSNPFTLTSDQGWELGENTLTVEYGGSGSGDSDYLDSISEAMLTINGIIAKEITMDGITISSQDKEITYIVDNGFKLTENGSYTIAGKWDGSITGATVNHCKSVIYVESGVDAEITLSSVNIDVSGTDFVAAFQVADNSTGNVTITLEENNVLKSGGNCAGLQKNGDKDGIGKLTIKGDGVLEAVSSSNGAGIGGGYDGEGSNITISGGVVEATSYNMGAGIGGGAAGAGSNITISGGTVTAKCVQNGAGIGGGYWKSGSNIIITGGTVTATGGTYGAGIGGGNRGAGSDITISGGTVTATGGDGNEGAFGGTGIGRGTYAKTDPAPASTGNKLDGKAVVFATHGAYGEDHISGFDNDDLTGGVLFEGSTGTVYGNPEISTDATIPQGKTLTITADQILTIGTDTALTNEGTIWNYGTLTKNGTFINHGTYNDTQSEAAEVTFVKADGSKTDKAAFGETVRLQAAI